MDDRESFSSILLTSRCKTKVQIVFILGILCEKGKVLRRSLTSAFFTQNSKDEHLALHVLLSYVEGFSRHRWTSVIRTSRSFFPGQEIVAELARSEPESNSVSAGTDKQILFLKS